MFKASEMLTEESEVLLLTVKSETSLFRSAFVSNAVDYTFEVSGDTSNMFAEPKRIILGNFNL